MDEHEQCCSWAGQVPSECDENPFFMKVHCPSSCGTANCTGSLQVTTYIATSPTLKIASIPVKNARSCKVNIRKDCRPGSKTPSAAAPTKDEPQSKKATNSGVPCPLPCPGRWGKVERPVEGCEDRHQLCSFWAWSGECEGNPVYMKRNCRFSCRLCP